MELTNLRNVDLDLRELAFNTVKYQNFKTKAALNKFDFKLKYITASNYFTLGISYIKTGTRNKAVGKKFYDYIDEALEQHVQPLTPSDKDRRIVHKNIYHKKGVVLPITKITKKLTEQPLTEKFEYGVMYDDTIKVFGTDKTKAKIFLAGIEFAGKEAKLVSITDLEE